MSWLYAFITLLAVLGAGMLLAFRAGKNTQQSAQLKEQLEDIRDAKDARDRYANDPEYRKRMQDTFRR